MTPPWDVDVGEREPHTTSVCASSVEITDLPAREEAFGGCPTASLADAASGTSSSSVSVLTSFSEGAGAAVFPTCSQLVETNQRNRTERP
jgi:hypothetical protein